MCDAQGFTFELHRNCVTCHLQHAEIRSDTPNYPDHFLFYVGYLGEFQTFVCYKEAKTTYPVMLCKVESLNWLHSSVCLCVCVCVCVCMCSGVCVSVCRSVKCQILETTHRTIFIWAWLHSSGKATKSDKTCLFGLVFI